MKKNMLSSLVVTLVLAFGSVAAKADSSSYVYGGVGAGTSVFFGSGVANADFHGDANTSSWNGGTNVQTDGGTSNSVVGALGSANGAAQVFSVANQTGNSANVSSASTAGSNVNVIWGSGSSVAGSYANGSAWHP